MTKRRQNTKVSPLLGMRERSRQRFEQDGGDMSPALFKTVERRPKANCREMREVSPLSNKGKGKRQRFGQGRGNMSLDLFKKAEWRPKANYREMQEVRWRQKRCSKPKQDGKCSVDDCSVDLISMLPDDLLGSILSRITLKEQIATSILSHRWRYLWTLTTRLDCDGVDSTLSLGRNKFTFGAERRHKELAFEKLKLDFLSLVNHVLASRREGSTIEDFKVHFDLGKKDEAYISEWLRYALACKVQRLELNLHTTLLPTAAKTHYVFPNTLLSLIDDRIHFKQLKTISFNRVGVDSKALEFFLHNCPLLEDLSVTKSPELLSLRVTGPSPSLKRLEISNCFFLNSLEICDVNLVCFKYRGKEIRFVLRNLPRLVHLSVSKSIFEYMKVNVAWFSSILKQLEIFHVILESMESFLLPMEMSNLRQLKVLVSSFKFVCDESLLWLADLIQSAPCLEKFALESHRFNEKFPNRKLQRKMIGNLYPHLKDVEFVGFCGVPSDVEFVFHFVDNAAALKKIIVDTKKTDETINGRMLPVKSKCKVVLDQLEEHLALEKPGIKLEFICTNFLAPQVPSNL